MNKIKTAMFGNVAYYTFVAFTGVIGLFNIAYYASLI